MDTACSNRVLEFKCCEKSLSLELTFYQIEFVVDGANIPDVDFDVGPSFAGLLPITSNASDPDQLYWWFWPSDNEDSEKEILIWLNGGVGLIYKEAASHEN